MEEKVHELIQKARDRSLEEKDFLLEVIHLIHEEFGGDAPPEALEIVAERLDIPPSRVYEVATFYSLFTLKKEAQHIIRVCASLPCHVSGGKEIIQTLKEELGIDFGEVTQDKMFKLESVGCLGRCDTSPNMMIDNALYRDLTPEKVRAILDAYRKGVIE